MWYEIHCDEFVVTIRGNFSDETRRTFAGKREFHLRETSRLLKSTYCFLGREHVQLKFRREDCTHRELVIRTAILLMSVCHCADRSRRNLTTRQILAIIAISDEKREELNFMASIASKLLELSFDFYVNHV